MTRAVILIIALALMAFSILGLSRPAHAQAAHCAAHDEIVAGLAVNFGQSLAAIGVTGNQLVAETFTSPKGTWTFAGTGIDGVTCIIASGYGHEVVGLPKAGVPG